VTGGEHGAHRGAVPGRPGPDEIAPGVYVATAEQYTTTTTVIAGDDGGCLLVDPAVSVADLAALARWLTARDHSR
jgi:hydroxyacylglutathione hydrolase